MSQSTVIATVKACLTDSQYGLAMRVDTIANALAEIAGIGVEQVMREFHFNDSRPSAQLSTTTLPIVSVRAVRWDARHRYANLRDAEMDVEVRIENFAADELVAKTNCDICADALALVLDDLREFSDRQQPKGPVIDVLAVDDVMLSVLSGTFDDPASTGFVATFRVQERTNYV